MIGCFVIGFLWRLFLHVSISPEIHAMIMVGIIGSFTTFSTYSLDTVLLMKKGEMSFALLYICISPAIGLALSFIGLYCARYTVSILR
jgi:CrcB protein